MNKSALIFVLVTSLSILFSIPITADAKGGHFVAGPSGYPSSASTIEQKIFSVTPFVFRGAMTKFQKEYPQHSCGEWHYRFSSQTYNANCSKKDRTKNYGDLYLTMDGYIKFTAWGDEIEQKTVILGDWGVFTN